MPSPVNGPPRPKGRIGPIAPARRLLRKVSVGQSIQSSVPLHRLSLPPATSYSEPWPAYAGPSEIYAGGGPMLYGGVPCDCEPRGICYAEAQILALRARGLSIVLSTHDPGHAFACATVVALLHEGTLQGLGPPEAVLVPERLAAVYGVPVSVARLPDGRLVCAPDLA